MLRNNLKGIVDRDHLTQLLEQLEVNHLARAEDPSVAQWVSLANELSVRVSLRLKNSKLSSMRSYSLIVPCQN